MYTNTPESHQPIDDSARNFSDNGSAGGGSASGIRHIAGSAGFHFHVSALLTRPPVKRNRHEQQAIISRTDLQEAFHVTALHLDARWGAQWVRGEVFGLQ